ncbi:antibiotic biosynthesis monooxygenase family protein [Billgrantia kenyensis]|jgi:heme-degrading monooxygenase HmoA|uniref:Antibiotic biosynthesis monooxygenase n=1 Tax=Billgrantia kenyensis TaxID=321266 RepID=A0A7V9W395_9GAMM|nr:antibiotic biosynthesis monooxygenase [Halomonas kenyensis]MBA2780253.1 antibiotic biosynthesis monooxygenase [Halomonas kenyensis]MCG6663169.1 antibiotic biosynthesis monooxygenase [Halomonas kenyensis]
MTRIAKTPEPPYYAVIFTSLRTAEEKGYGVMAEYMAELAAQQPGFLGLESVREELGVTVSYWESLEAIKQWKQQVEHREAQRLGRSDWYAAYKVRIARVERDYHFGTLDD